MGPRRFWLGIGSLPALLATLTLVGCHGGGGGSGGGADIFPLWVPTDVAIADVDGDGRADILTLAQYATGMNSKEGRLVVHLQRSPGAFTTTQTVSFGTYPWKMALADIDGDGAVDVAASDADGARGVWILLQDRANRGQFLPAQEVGSGFNGYGIAIADLNGDSLPDIAVTSNSASLALLYQNASPRGSFGPVSTLPVPGVGTDDVAAGDLDGDGRADLVMSVSRSPTNYTPNDEIGICLQRPDGTLGPVTTMAPRSGLNPRRMRIADYDGDGLSDVFAYSTASSTAYESTMTVLLQGPVPGTYAAPAETSMQELNGEDDAVFADLDGDDRPDAAVTGFYPVGSPSSVRASLHRFTQSGGGRFAIVSSDRVSLDASRIAAGDVDGDGRNELVLLAGEDQFVVIN